ncbi:hypothetical protein QM291_21885, partial [Pseudomonas aeruginosa]|nr:hypothetical protein [Pseudomonas aeruginosa]
VLLPASEVVPWTIRVRPRSLMSRLLEAEQRGILTRQFEQPASLRLGLPADEAAWARLDAALLGFKEPAHE